MAFSYSYFQVMTSFVEANFSTSTCEWVLPKNKRDVEFTFD